MDSENLFIAGLVVVITIGMGLATYALVDQGHRDTAFDIACVKSGKVIKYNTVLGISGTYKECR